MTENIFLEGFSKVMQDDRDNFLKELAQVLTEKDVNNLLRNIMDSNPGNSVQQLLKIFSGIIQEDGFKKITNNVIDITDEPRSIGHYGITRKQVLGVIDQFTKSASIHDTFDETNRIYTPVLNDNKKKYLIEVNFAGLGSEVNGVHYAIVWEAHNNRDDIVLIPTTSFKDFSTKEKPCLFNIGNVGHMSKNTVVKLDQITTISRKRIKNVVVTDSTTGTSGLATLSNEQVERIMEGLRILCLNEGTLLSKEILSNQRDRLPVFDDPVLQYNHLNLPYKIVSISHEKVVYTLLNDPSNTKYNLYRKKTSLNQRDRKNLIFKWVNAVALYDRSSKPWVLIKSREQVREEAYNQIQSTISSESDSSAS